MRPRGESHWAARLTEAQAIEILASKERTVDLARRFGVGWNAIDDIRAGRNWKHLPGERRPGAKRSRQTLRADGSLSPYPHESAFRSCRFTSMRARAVKGGGVPRRPDPLIETADRMLPQVLRDGEGLELFVECDGERRAMPAWSELEEYPRWTGRMSDPRVRVSSRVPRPRIDPLRG